jgi:hypothetical protein
MLGYKVQVAANSCANPVAMACRVGRERERSCAATLLTRRAAAWSGQGASRVGGGVNRGLGGKDRLLGRAASVCAPLLTGGRPCHHTSM